MPKPRPNSKRQRILAFFAQGERDLAKIARLTGSTLSSVTVYASEAGITRRQAAPHHRELVAAWDAGERDVEKLRETFGYRTISTVRTILHRHGRTKRGVKRIYTKAPIGLFFEASDRGAAPDEFVAKLLAKIDEDDLYNAVLDEGDPK